MSRQNISELSGTPTAMRLGAGPDRLDSWKEIASYLKREVRTVQLWEKKEGLPVHRHYHNQLGTVFAFRSEIEQWGDSKASKRLGAGDEGTSVVAANQQPLDGRPLRIAVSSWGGDSTDQPIYQKIVEVTLAALEQLDPSRVSILRMPHTVRIARPVLVSTMQSAEYVLTWSARDEVDGHSITASLLWANNQTVAWSQTFQLRPGSERGESSLVADQIVQCLWLKIVSVSGASLGMGGMEKASSRQAYLKGRYFWSRRNEDSLRKAVEWFRTAIHEDPGFALPYSGLADSLTLLSFYEIVAPSEAMPEARRAALKAVELGPNLAEAHASLADIYLHFDRDWESADREYRRAIQCNPEYVLGYHWYANLLAARGQHEAAQLAIMHALEIDPASLITQVWAGVTSHLAHHFEDAIRHYQSALELDPQFLWVHMYMGQALVQQGNFKEALLEFETTIRLAGGSNCVTAMKAHAHALAGDRALAQKILLQLEKTPGKQCMPSYDIAAAYAALGDSAQAVCWLKRACSERNMKLFMLTQDPRFDPLRHRPEFRDVVESIGLKRYQPALSMS